jgi:hypothetical protein
MHVIIVSHRWNDGLEHLGDASIPHTYLGSLEQTGAATFETFYLDEWHQRNGSLSGAENALSELVSRTSSPAIVLFTWLYSTPKMNLSAEIFRRISQEWKVPIVLSIHDSTRPWEIQMGEVLFPYVDLILCADGTDRYLTFTDTPEKYRSTWMPLDTRRFAEPAPVRDIDVSFLGRMYNEREIFLRYLLVHGIPVSLGHWTDEASKVPLDLYAETLKRSKMTLNTARTGEGDTLKWRVMEATLAGTLLLEFADGTTKKWYEPMVDYVPFENEVDLLDKVRFFLTHEAERAQIAMNGYQKAWSRYTGIHWWHWLFNTLAQS